MLEVDLITLPLLEPIAECLWVCACIGIAAAEAPLAGSISRDEFHSRLGTLPVSQEIAVHCACPGGSCAAKVVDHLRLAGFFRARLP